MVFIIICLMAILTVAMACFLVIGIAVFCIGAKTLSNKCSCSGLFGAEV